MLREHFAALFRLYINPAAALGRILDRGRLWLAALLALGVSILLHAFDAGPKIVFSRPGWWTGALLRFISYTPGSYFAALMVVAIAVVPAIVLCRAVSGYGSVSVLMRSDYVSLLVCALMCWAAAYLPLAVARIAIDSDWLDEPLAYLAFNLYFVALTAVSVRTVFGTGLGASAAMAALGWGAGVLGAGLLAAIGSALGFLMSPFILYLVYVLFASDLRSFGEGLRSRQHLQQQLEIATNNPHDADAHYQLGLIYQKRRQYTEASAHFERAIQIDPEDEADAHYQLGRIALEQERFEDAIRHLNNAAAIDDKLALSDVWRDLGAAYLGASRLEEAVAALEKYTQRRPYDPEGLYWHGKTLERKERHAQAREMFERCVEAVRTTPANRRAQVRKWGSQAQAELRR